MEERTNKESIWGVTQVSWQFWLDGQGRNGGKNNLQILVFGYR